MPSIYEVPLTWVNPRTPGGTSVLHLEGTVSMATATAALLNWFDLIKSNFGAGTQFSIPTGGKELDDVTGSLVGFWAGPGGTSVLGTGVGSSVPNATQILNRMRTPAIINGRLLQGRWFLPGACISALSVGELTNAAITNINNANATLLGAVPEMGVWHRPVGGAGGQFTQLSSLGVWNELAVLRRRR